jgi:TPR repeat protein
MKLSLVFASVALIPALAAIPPGVSKKSVSGYANITLYERPSAQTLPSFWESFYKLFRIPSATNAKLPFQRSVAVLVGIGHYQFITPKLEYVSTDVEKMRDYLLGDGGFDAVYVMDEGVSPEVVKIFMSDELPQSLAQDDRLLFYYSGHGADPGTGHPFLLFQRARPNQWGQNVLRVDEYEQWSGLLKIKHLLFLFDACTAGEAAMAKGPDNETRAAVTELSGNGSRIVVMAGTARQQAWVVGESSARQYSIFTEALLRVLRDGTAESKNRGFMTIGQAVHEAEVVMADITRHLGPGHTMNPYLVKIDGTRTGTFVFLNPHARQPQVPQADILTMGITARKGAAGAELEQEMELAYWKSIEDLGDPQLYTRLCEEFPNGLFCPVARRRLEKLRAAVSTAAAARDLTIFGVTELRSLADSGSRDALTQLGRVYESGLQGAPVDLQASIGFYERASDLGDGNASYRIGAIYFSGRRGVPKDDAKAASWFRKAADAGNGTGMVNLGALYQHGVGGLPKDDAQAVRWYRKAADAGDGLGMSDLGFMYANGLGGLPKDDAQAVGWYRRAAEAGSGAGMANLGLAYLKGLGALPKDEAQALAWFRKAVGGGSGRGMAGLGIMYANGLGGLPKDEVQAVSWFRKAADTGDGLGMANLGLAYLHGLGGLVEDDAQALAWFRKAADGGDGTGMTNLGFMYANGLGGLPKDDAQAASWYRRAADAGEAHGMANLGGMYGNGLGGLPKDEAQALTWFRKAADAGDGFGMANLGLMYGDGRGGLPRDDAQALTWFRKAADAGDGFGMAHLGYMYAEGQAGLPKDDVQAVNWLRKAADAGDGLGMADLGFMYENGRGGLPKDVEQAVAWYRKAAQVGEPHAQAALWRLGR